MNIEYVKYDKPEGSPDTHVIICKAMFGDGDHYQDVRFVFDKINDFKNACKVFHNLVEMLKLPENDNRNCEIMLEFMEAHSWLDEWPWNERSDCAASFDGIVEILYYDDNCTKFNVLVEY